MSFYIVLKNIKAQHVNSLNNINNVGFPAITGFLGFAESIAFTYKVKSNGVCIIHKGQELEAHVDKYKNIYTNKTKGASYSIDGKKPNNIALSDQPSVLSFFSCSLVLSFEQEDCKELRQDMASGKFDHNLYAKKRFIGGNIIDIEKIVLYEDWDSICDYLNKEEKGFFVLDARNEVNKKMENQNLSQLEAVRDLLYFQQEDFIPKLDSEEFKKRWFALTSVGYYFINKPKKMLGSRENKRHAFVENMLGLIEFKSKRELDDILNEQDIFWMYKEEDFLIAAQQTYF